MLETLTADFADARVLVWEPPSGLRDEPHPAPLSAKVAYAIEAHEAGALKVEISISGRLLNLDEIRGLHARFEE